MSIIENFTKMNAGVVLKNSTTIYISTNWRDCGGKGAIIVGGAACRATNGAERF